MGPSRRGTDDSVMIVLRAPWLSLAGCLILSGCAKTVQVEVPARPVVALDAASVAVVSLERDCRPFANAIAVALGDGSGLTVNPAAPIRLNVLECGHTYVTEVVVDQQASEDGPTSDRRRVSVQGRGHAVVAVERRGNRIEAHLIGAGRETVRGSWQQVDALALHRTVEDQLVSDVAHDLARQISPLPQLVERRLYPNASTSSPRGLLTEAVRAELTGDLTRAHALALAADDAHSTARSAAYVVELQRRLQTLPP